MSLTTSAFVGVCFLFDFSQANWCGQFFVTSSLDGTVRVWDCHKLEGRAITSRSRQVRTVVVFNKTKKLTCCILLIADVHAAGRPHHQHVGVRTFVEYCLGVRQRLDSSVPGRLRVQG
jgi:hypothetical protein